MFSFIILTLIAIAVLKILFTLFAAKGAIAIGIFIVIIAYIVACFYILAKK